MILPNYQNKKIPKYFAPIICFSRFSTEITTTPAPANSTITPCPVGFTGTFCQTPLCNGLVNGCVNGGTCSGRSKIDIKIGRQYDTFFSCEQHLRYAHVQLDGLDLLAQLVRKLRERERITFYLIPNIFCFSHSSRLPLRMSKWWNLYNERYLQLYKSLYRFMLHIIGFFDHSVDFRWSSE